MQCWLPGHKGVILEDPIIHSHPDRLHLPAQNDGQLMRTDGSVQPPVSLSVSSENLAAHPDHTLPQSVSALRQPHTEI